MRKLLRTYGFLLFALVVCLSLPTAFYAAESGMTSSKPYAYNEDTGYEIYIDDWADLLTTSEEDELMNVMSPITAYGNAAFISIDSNPEASVEAYAENYGYSHFGNSSYTLFIIDMDYRKVCVYSDGEIYQTITTAYANTITDNVYSYASDEAYYDCAVSAFEQIAVLLEGGSIAQPMKYISNALLALVLALLINYFIVMFVSRSAKANDAQLLHGIYKKVNVINPTTTFLHQTKHYSPQNTGSRGGRGGHGGGHGGGGRSGGGGGGSHSF